MESKLKDRFATSIISTTLVMITFLVVDGAHGFSHGCPLSSCTDMFPRHGERQGGSSPIKISTDVSCYSADQDNPGVKVTVKAEDGKKYKGIGLQVRLKDSDEIAQGSFSGFDEDSYKINRCYGEKNYFSHTDDNLKESTSLTWTPSSNQGALEITYTTVLDFNTFWVKEKVDLLQCDE